MREPTLLVTSTMLSSNRDQCNLKEQPAEKHWCPGCQQPIHAVCDILDDKSQESSAYMNWCHDCDEQGCKMPAHNTAPKKWQEIWKPPPQEVSKTPPAPLPLPPPPPDPLTEEKQSSRSKEARVLSKLWPLYNTHTL